MLETLGLANSGDLKADAVGLAVLESDTEAAFLRVLRRTKA